MKIENQSSTSRGLDLFTRGLNLADDSGRSPAEMVQESNNRLAANHINLVDHYMKGHFDIVIDISQTAPSHVYQLVFSAIPKGCHQTQFAGLVNRNFVERELADRLAHRDQVLVFLGNSDLVESPEGVIPSFVRLEAPIQRFNFFGESGASISNSANNAFLSSAKWEVQGAELVFAKTASCSNRVCCLIKALSNVSEGISSNSEDFIRHFLSESNLKDILAGIGVNISPVGVGLAIEKRFDSNIKITCVSLCVPQSDS